MAGTRKLGRATDSRNAMLRAMVTYLIENGKIETTVTRAKDVRSMAEKMITLGKSSDLHTKRQVYSYITKDCNGKENPAQCWASVHDEEKGIAIITQNKYSFSCDGRDLRFVAARSCCFADHFGKRDGLEDFQDMGEHRFRYVILPHDKLCGGELAKRTAQLQMPLRAIHETFHDGPLTSKAGWVGEIPGNVMLEAVKRMEDGSGFVARLYETDGNTADFTLDLLGKSAKLQFAPFEIKTVCFPAHGEPVETDLLEGI